MHVFLDFEASSLAKRSYPIEIAWVFEDGVAETHLIRPAAGWTDWDEAAAAIHGISREELQAKGEPHAEIARHMLDVLSAHSVYASSPSWDGKWLSVLLRAAGLPRHALRLNNTDQAQMDAALDGLDPAIAEPEREVRATALIARIRAADSDPIAHRALPDALHERKLWLAIRRAAEAEAATPARSQP
jgi:hypothetical protein